MNIDINIPDVSFGPWKISEFEVSEKDASFFNLRAMFRPGARTITPGKYKRLTRYGSVIMSSTPAEIRDHLGFIYRSRESGGHILINGLGLGVALKAILESDKVSSVTVIEISHYVIRMVGPFFENDERVTIICDDAFEWKPPRGIRYSAVWHDIWDNICSDNLDGMRRLHRKYARITDWQGSWCRELCKRGY